jgi:hypothetical protein
MPERALLPPDGSGSADGPDPYVGGSAAALNQPGQADFLLSVEQRNAADGSAHVLAECVAIAFRVVDQLGAAIFAIRKADQCLEMRCSFQTSVGHGSGRLLVIPGSFDQPIGRGNAYHNHPKTGHELGFAFGAWW